MATVTGYTAQRMKQIEDSTIVDGDIVGTDLILKTRDGSNINAGSVQGPIGPDGPPGPTSIEVCTSTTRPTGGSLFTGLGIYETNTKRFYIYNGTAWVYSGEVVICTSTTRPTSPPAGMEIFESDTGWKWIYTGSVWLPTSFRILGRVERTTVAGPVSTTAAAISSMSITFTLATTRSVKIEAYIRHFTVSAPSDYGIVQIRKQDNSVLAEGLFGASSVAGGVYLGSSMFLSRIISMTAGTYTLSLWCGAAVGTVTQINATASSPMTLYATDVGS